MKSREQLERQVAELEAENALLRRGVRRLGVRYASEFTFAGLPLVSLASGPDPDRKEVLGHARGVIAVGDIATGVVAIGGVARGLVALGGLALGGVALGGASVGALVAIGGLAIGTFAMGGGALGGAAIGGGAADGRHADPEAIAFFADYGLEGACTGQRPRRQR